MKLSVRHHTRYRYHAVMQFTPHRLCLRPREDHHVRVNDFNIETSPPSALRWIHDCQDNSIAIVTPKTESSILELTVTMTVDLLESNPFDFILDYHAATFPFQYVEIERAALQPCLQLGPSEETAAVAAWIEKNAPARPCATILLLTTLCQAVRAGFEYQRRDEEGVQTPQETLSLNRGTCRDFAILFIAICRQLGLAARFASGYLYDPPNEEGVTENRAHGSMHAWTEVYLPGAGWKGFDPTNGILTTDYFIPVAVAPTPDPISPIQGSYVSKVPVKNSMEVQLHIERLDTPTP
jgi:hypothetical protein